MSAKSRRRFSLNSIKSKLIVAFVAVGLPPAVGIGWLATSRSNQVLVDGAGQRLRIAAENIIDKIDRDLAQRYADVQAIANAQHEDATPEQLIEAANQFVATYDVYDLVMVADADGNILAVNDHDMDEIPIETGAILGRNVSSQEWFDAATNGDLFEGDSYYSDITEDADVADVMGGRGLTIEFSAPVRNASGEITHVWSTRASPDRIINEILAEQLDAFWESGATSVAIQIVSQTGALLASGSDEEQDQILSTNLAASGLESASKVTNGERGFLEETDPQTGTKQITGYANSIGARTFDGNGWGVLVRQNRDEATARAINLRNFIALIVVIAAVVTILFAGWVSRSFSRPIVETVKMLHNIAQGDGDLTKRLEVKSSDEIGEMASLFNTFVDNLHSIISQIRATAESVSGASVKMNGASVELSEGAQQQASSLEETAASLEEITATVKQTADNAGEASKVTVEARDTADRGGAVVREAVEAMSGINESSKKIAEIITTINEIAFQTNLLAINAATEAARAGEQGRGFAVVAAEVRNLAGRSAEAAKEIKDLINDSVTRVDHGTVLVNNSGESLEAIVTAVSRATDIVVEIAAASREQSSGIEEVNRAVTHMDRATQTNATQTEHVTITAQELAAQAAKLSELVGKFKLSDTAAAGSGIDYSEGNAQWDRPQVHDAAGGDRFRRVEQMSPGASQDPFDDEWSPQEDESGMFEEF